MEAETARRRPLFAVGGDVHRWEDVVALARVRGDWEEIREAVRSGLAALRELEERGEAVPEEDVEAAGREFRYARRLLAGDELDAWLERRDLDRALWEAYLERLVARRRVPAPGPADIPEPAVEAALWPEAMCSGRLDDLARGLALLLAVAPDVPLEELEAALEAFRKASASDELVAREIETNRLEWLRVSYEAADFDDEDAAREAALCVREDHETLSEVAARAGAAAEKRTEWLEELPPELGSAVLASRPGDLVGPVEAAEGFRLALLLEKIQPSVEDEDVRRRAAAAVAERAVERAATERVVWLEAL